MHNDMLEAIGMVAFVAGLSVFGYGLWLVAPVLVWLVGGAALLAGGVWGIAAANRGDE